MNCLHLSGVADVLPRASGDDSQILIVAGSHSRANNRINGES